MSTTLEFTERMAGHCTVPAQELSLPLERSRFAIAEKDENARDLEFTLTIRINDLDRFIADPDLLADVSGTVTSPLLGGTCKVDGGAFNLFTRPGVSPDLDAAKEMHYKLFLRDSAGNPLTLYGFKEIVKEDGIDAWNETTTLYTYIWEGHEDFSAGPKRRLRALGVLHISVADFLHQLTTFKVSGKNSGDLVPAVAKFLGVFAKNLWDAYAPCIFTTTTSRWNEHLYPVHTLSGVPSGHKTVIPFDTEDGLSLSLHRFHETGSSRKKTKDVVLLLHGLTTSTDMFIMPEHLNLVSYLKTHGFEDVWTLDWRGSGRFIYNLAPHRFTIDDVVQYDIPKAIEVIRNTVGSDAKIHVIAHCVGSLSLMCALAAGKVRGLASVISNSVSLTPRVRWQGLLKLIIGPAIMESLLGYAYISPRIPYMPGLNFGKWVYWMERSIRRECKEPACHMISFMWGWGFPAAYRHENLHPVTHRRLVDLFGGTSFNYYRHIRKMLFAKEAVPYCDDPGYRGLPESYLANVDKVDLPPTLLMSGSENLIFPRSNKLSYDEIKKRAPRARVEYLEIPGYGHQDVFMGRNAHVDVFPRLVEFLDRHRS